ncbi:MAG: DNA mismatch repair protein MutS [Candidatus Hydrogenedentes bacterium]|nr:DNA mismatch repair protein MutS [Candidatus Hydrogenedentota bacterium]
MKLRDVAPSKVTPMLRQFIEAKAESGDSLLFFRMGDFYELFFEDALEASELLGLSLTSRDGAEKLDRIPMAGVPVRSVDVYIAKAIKAGRTVAICDQMEDPKEVKGIVKRSVVRTITPGTILEPDLLEERSNNYLGAVHERNGSAGLALLDLSTGEFLAAEIGESPRRVLIDELTRLAPVELLYAGRDASPLVETLQKYFPGITFTRRDEGDFETANGRETVQDTFGLSTLKGLDLDDAPAATGCAGALLEYVRATQRDAVPHIQHPRRYNPGAFVVLDGNTQRNLELTVSVSGKGKQGTLINVLDRTLTSMGGRMIRQWILHPLLDVAAIHRRLNAVEELFEQTTLRMGLREVLKGMADVERLLGRLSAKAGNGRDMRALGQALGRLPQVRALLRGVESDALGELRDTLDPMDDVAGWIESAIVDTPPITISEGNVIRDGYDAELDRLRGLVRGGKDWIAALQAEERDRTGIVNLKVGYNKVFGYFLEVTKSYHHLVPPEWERKQTLVNAERYITPRLKSREEEIVTAEERMQKLEYDLFVALRERVAGEARRIHGAAAQVAMLDTLLSFAEVSVSKDYRKPEVNDGNGIVLRDGRHPVVEDLMKRGDFVPNDTVFLEDEGALQIVTGPNMAGKSTYLRQVAIITLMAQIGCFVPAASATIGVVDRIFTRVGASDNLVRGESTFMVEMIETATILNTATARSLLVLDEIGRGTSTFDGISIAWSVAEYIHDRIRAKTLFATHYHELTELGRKLERAKNMNVTVREYGDKVIFLYRIAEGGADHSYGIQVAKLAGLPYSVIARAREILESLESGNTASVGLPEQMYLFGSSASGPSPVEKELASLDPDTLSPREAHDMLYHLKHLLDKPRKG